MIFFGYNKNSYNRKTVTFKIKLNEILEKLQKCDVDKTILPQALSATIDLFDRFEYLKGKNTKAIEAADEYIGDLIVRIECSARNSSDLLLALNLKLLSDILLSDVRSRGEFSEKSDTFLSNRKFVDAIFELKCALEEEMVVKTQENEVREDYYNAYGIFDRRAYGIMNEHLSTLEERVSQRVRRCYDALNLYKETYKESLTSSEYQFYDNLIGNRFIYEDRFVSRVCESILNKILGK